MLITVLEIEAEIKQSIYISAEFFHVNVGWSRTGKCFFLHRRVTGFVQTWKMISLEPSVQSKSSSRPLPDDDHELLCPEQSPLHIALENKN